MNNIKKFEDFLNRMQGLLDNAKKQGHIIVRVEDLESTFPELKESKDERIRKELIAFLKENHETGRADETWSLSGIERWIAWLEKQDEQKSIDNLTQQEAMDIAVAKHFEQGEQKPAWSEEDEKVIHCLEYTVRHFYEDEDTIKWCCDWLRFLKDRVLPQPQQEWSKEDKYNLSDIEAMIHTMKGDGLNADKLINWFKSLRPHNRWKPSDEQMGVIEAVINNRSFQRRHLDSLYEQLKKLKGE